MHVARAVGVDDPVDRYAGHGHRRGHPAGRAGPPGAEPDHDPGQARRPVQQHARCGLGVGRTGGQPGLPVVEAQPGGPGQHRVEQPRLDVAHQRSGVEQHDRPRRQGSDPAGQRRAVRVGQVVARDVDRVTGLRPDCGQRVGGQPALGADGGREGALAGARRPSPRRSRCPRRCSAAAGPAPVRREGRRAPGRRTVRCRARRRTPPAARQLRRPPARSARRRPRSPTTAARTSPPGSGSRSTCSTRSTTMLPSPSSRRTGVTPTGPARAAPAGPRPRAPAGGR